MDSKNPTAPLGVNPRHLGLPRRQSFDPLSSSKGGLSLGQLPAPSLGEIPAGLRSVPAIESSRHALHLGSLPAFRNVSTPLGDGQRTPGGSLVIGAEVFGFGKYAPTPKGEGRKQNGSYMDGAQEEGPTSRIGTSDWPSEFESRATASTDDLRLRDDSRLKHGMDRLSADFSLAGRPRPHLKTTGSSVDLRSSSPAGSMTEPSLRAPSRSSLLPPSSHLAHSQHSASSDTTSHSQEASPLGSTGGLSSPNTAASTGASTSSGGPSPYGANQHHLADTTPSPNSGPYVYPFQPPDPSPPPLGNPYFNHAGFAVPMSPPQFPRNGRVDGYGGYAAGAEQLSPDDLAFGLRGVNLNGSAVPNGMNGGSGRASQAPSRDSGFSPGPYGGPAAGRDTPARQNSTGYSPYGFMGSPGSPYMAAPPQDPYSPMTFAAPTFYSPDGPGGRRDSVPVPGWGLTMPPFALPPDLQPPSVAPSRNGSLSYPSGLTGHHQQANGIPTGAYAPGAAPGGVYAPSSPYDQVPPASAAGMYAAGPQLGQQHQIILGRGVGRGVEYIAPGPVQQHQYGAGYGPDMRGLRSPLLEEFRSNRNRSWELSDLAGHIVEFSGDQLGSRHIQTKLDTATSEEKAMVFAEILPNMLQLSTDVFANYVIQKFFEQGNQVQKTAMAKVLETHVLQLSLQMYGCRVVQKALEYVLVDQQVRLVKELDGHVLKCARDAQSNHVVQRALERVPPEHLHFITDACLGQVHSLATHPYGCRVLQRIFENCPPPQTRALLDELHRFTQNLIQDQYGNYVVQWVIEKGERPDKSLVVAKIYGQVLPLAQQKFASNVVEKCIIHGTDEERHRLIEEVLQPGADGTSIVKAMLTHPYANYVVQKCLACAVSPQREALFAEVTNQLINLRRYSAPSKHLVTIAKLLSNERDRLGLPPLDLPLGPPGSGGIAYGQGLDGGVGAY
ncbi:hypothetical protein JCM11251_002379 [Rhodosporidiobolus azoricus]